MLQKNIPQAEACLLEGGERVRNATVTASEAVQALSLHRDDLARLQAAGVLDSTELRSTMRGVREERASTTAAAVAAAAAERGSAGSALPRVATGVFL